MHRLGLVRVAPRRRPPILGPQAAKKPAAPQRPAAAPAPTGKPRAAECRQYPRSRPSRPPVPQQRRAAQAVMLDLSEPPLVENCSVLPVEPSALPLAGGGSDHRAVPLLCPIGRHGHALLRPITRGSPTSRRADRRRDRRVAGDRSLPASLMARAPASGRAPFHSALPPRPPRAQPLRAGHPHDHHPH